MRCDLSGVTCEREGADAPGLTHAHRRARRPRGIPRSAARFVFRRNNDPASFAPNLDPHPGVAQIATVLRSIAQRPTVSAVVVQIDEVLDPSEWPYAPAAYVITSSDPAEVHRWPLRSNRTSRRRTQK